MFRTLVKSQDQKLFLSTLSAYDIVEEEEYSETYKDEPVSSSLNNSIDLKDSRHSFKGHQDEYFNDMN